MAGSPVQRGQIGLDGAAAFEPSPGLSSDPHEGNVSLVAKNVCLAAISGHCLIEFLSSRLSKMPKNGSGVTLTLSPLPNPKTGEGSWNKQGGWFSNGCSSASFLSPVQVPGPAPNLQAMSNTPSSVSLSWDKPVTGNGDIVTYKLYYTDKSVGNEEVGISLYSLSLHQI